MNTPQIGEENSQAKLEERDVRAIRLLYKTGEWSGNKLAELFGTSRRNIYKILDGTTWSHV